jgi:hypothetical protein
MAKQDGQKLNVDGPLEEKVIQDKSKMTFLLGYKEFMVPEIFQGPVCVI